MNCCICSSPKKYKCRDCLAPYCSIPCFKTHQAICSKQKPEKMDINSLNIDQEAIVKTDYVPDQNLRIPQAKLERLRSDPRLKELLKNQKLRNKLIAIDNSKQRITNVHQSLGDEQFSKFFELILDILQMSSDGEGNY